jgi:methionyl-tRNA formyltransferase
MSLARPLRVVFLGTPAFAIPSLEGVLASGAELVAVVCQPDRPKGRGLELQPPPTKVWAEARGLPVHQPEKVRNGRLRALLEPYAPDLLVVTAYGRILPKEVLDLPPLGALNGHASLLPRYRGAAPIQWAVARGETTTGVTVMQMDEGLDTGDIRLVRTLEIGEDETAAGLHDRLAALAGDALREAIELLSRDALPRTPQDHAQATLAPLLSKEDAELDWTRPARELVWRVRGFTPWPGTVLRLAGRPLKVHAARAVEGRGEPGTVVEADDVVRMATGDGLLELVEVQPEGKRRMGVRDFLGGHRLVVGDRFDVPLVKRD